jgi:hypothetical protein
MSGFEDFKSKGNFPLQSSAVEDFKSSGFSDHTYIVKKELLESCQVYDSVNNPKHYNSGKFEVIDIIEDQNLGFCLGNAIKYILRAGKKDESKTKEDLEKAIWYINRHIGTLK